MSSVSRIPSVPATKSLDELAEACGTALAVLQEDPAVALQCFDQTWIVDALKGDLTDSKKRSSAASAVWYVYNATIEVARLQAPDSPLFEELKCESREALLEMTAFDHQASRRVRNALFELEGREKFAAAEERRKHRDGLAAVREHALERERAIRGSVRTGPSGVNRSAAWRARKKRVSQAGPTGRTN